MKKLKGLLTTSVVFILATAAQTQVGTTLNLKVSGMRNSEGKIRVALSETSDAQNMKVAASGAFDVQEGMNSVVFENLAAGTYYIFAFHDENDNGTIDRNDMGMPSEGFVKGTSSEMFPSVKIIGNDTTVEKEVKMAYLF